MPRTRPFATPDELVAVGSFFALGTLLVALDTAETWLWLVVVCWLALAAAGSIHMRRSALARDRANRGQCVRCGYDLRGNVSGVCPECGSSRVSETAGTKKRGK